LIIASITSLLSISKIDRISIFGIDILCVTYFLTYTTMPDRKNGDMRQKR